MATPATTITPPAPTTAPEKLEVDAIDTAINKSPTAEAASPAGTIQRRGGDAGMRPCSAVVVGTLEAVLAGIHTAISTAASATRTGPAMSDRLTPTPVMSLVTKSWRTGRPKKRMAMPARTPSPDPNSPMVRPSPTTVVLTCFREAPPALSSPISRSRLLVPAAKAAPVMKATSMRRMVEAAVETIAGFPSRPPWLMNRSRVSP